jgi:hypothetical protein
MTMMAKRKKPVDHDLETWAALGGGVLEPPERELSEGERITAAGNEWVREQLQPTIVRTSPLSANPFQRR